MSLRNSEGPKEASASEGSDDSLGFYDEIESANQASRVQADLIGAYGQILRQITSKMTEILEKYGDDQQKKRFDEIGEMLSEKAKSMEKIVSGLKEFIDQHSGSFESVLLMLEEFNDAENNNLEAIRD